MSRLRLKMWRAAAVAAATLLFVLLVTLQLGWIPLAVR